MNLTYKKFTFWVLAQIFIKFFPAILLLGSLPIYLNKLDSNSFSFFALFLTAVQILSFTDFGINKFLIKKFGSNEYKNKLFMWPFFLSQMLLGFIVSIFLLFLIFFLNIEIINDGEFFNLYNFFNIFLLIFLFTLLFSRSVITSIFQINLFFNKLNLINGIKLCLLYLAPLVLLYFEKPNLMIYGMIVILILEPFYLIYYLNNKKKIYAFSLPKIKLLPLVLLKSRNFIFISLLSPAIAYMDRFFLINRLGSDIFNDYFVAQELYLKIVTVFGAVTYILYPVITQIEKNKFISIHKIFVFHIMLAFFAVLLWMYFSDEVLILWLKDSFNLNISLLSKIFIFSLPFQIISLHCINNIMLSTKLYLLSFVYIFEFLIYFSLFYFSPNISEIYYALFFILRLIGECVILIFIVTKGKFKNYLSDIFVKG